MYGASLHNPSNPNISDRDRAFMASMRDVLLKWHARDPPTPAEVLSPRTLSLFYIENTSVHRKGV